MSSPARFPSAGCYTGRTMLLILCIAASFSAVTTAEPVAPPPSLPRLSIDPTMISISGLSSGADFAVQFTVAFSSIVRGCGIFAGQPYHCAVTRFADEHTVPQCCGILPFCLKRTCTQSTPAPDVPICEPAAEGIPHCPAGRTLAYDHCKRTPWRVNVSQLAAYAMASADAGLIDPVVGLKSIRAYVYRGLFDTAYLPGSLEKVVEFFEGFGASVQFNHTTPSAHAWPTLNYGPRCGPNRGPIEACGYDGPGAALQMIYGPQPLHPPIAAGLPVPFDQTPFMSADNNGTAKFNETTPRATGFAPSGMVYIPATCRKPNSRCGLHFSLHGCDVDAYYDKAVAHLGFQRWAESNSLVIVWPRLQNHGGTTETQEGCWDSYGQTGRDYALKSGVQMEAVRRMITAVAGI